MLCFLVVWASGNINRGPSLPQQNNLTKMPINSIQTAIGLVTASPAVTPASIPSVNSNSGHHHHHNNNSNNTRNLNSLLMLRPSTPSITHFVNDSFIIFCATKPAMEKTRREIDITWLDPNGMPLVNVKGRVHIEKKTGISSFHLYSIHLYSISSIFQNRKE